MLELLLFLVFAFCFCFENLLGSCSSGTQPQICKHMEIKQFIGVQWNGSSTTSAQRDDRYTPLGRSSWCDCFGIHVLRLHNTPNYDIQLFNFKSTKLSKKFKYQTKWVINPVWHNNSPTTFCAYTRQVLMDYSYKPKASYFNRPSLFWISWI